MFSVVYLTFIIIEINDSQDFYLMRFMSKLKLAKNPSLCVGHATLVYQ